MTLILALGNIKIIYRPGLDGVRGLAVILVVFYHAGFNGFSGAFIGVDIFLVISGYLMTHLIYPLQLNDLFSFKKFYYRRLRRIVPQLFFAVAVTSLLMI